MSASLRFLAIAVVGWVGIRAMSLDVIPGGDMFSLAPAPAAAAPPIVPTQFPAIEPPPMTMPAAAPAYPYPPYPYPPHPAVIQVPVYYPVAAAAPAYAPPRQPAVYDLEPLPQASEPVFYSRIPPLGEWPVGPIAGGPDPVPATAPNFPPRLDRVQLSAWALLRGQSNPEALSSGGTLGGSQAGARLMYNFNPWLAASVRTSSPVNSSRGGEVAGGVRVQPLQSLPLYLTAERRQAIGEGGGRSAFALLVEGGLYQRPVPLGFDLDGYVQAGVVGINNRDLFADGGFTLTRPLFGRFSAGFGAWGGVQPGLYRVDVGPRVSMPVRRGMRVHLDWRQRVAGDALPASGPAVTLAADF